MTRFFLFACVMLAFAAAAAAPLRQPLYYQDPDGKPLYAAAPRQTTDGRAYSPVFADEAAPADHHILYYRNPMGLADRSAVPKTDSMGMAYVPVYADDAMQGDAPGTVRISPGRLQTLGVRTEPARMRPSAGRVIRATGTVQFDERRLATVTTKTAGWIEHLAVAATGDPVKRGQVLAEIYAPDIVASEAEYLIAARMGGEIGAAALQGLRARDVGEDDIARLRRTGRAARRMAVRAPADGVVIDKPVQEGMRVDAGMALYRTADLSDMWLIAQVPEQDIAAVTPGQVANVRFVAFPGRVFQGAVDFIAPSLAADTRTAAVRIVLPNPDRTLRAAMYASVEIAPASRGGPILTVPDDAVIDSGTTQVVLVAAGDGRFTPRAVTLGLHGDSWVQVREGITQGEDVVTGANFLIDSESNLRAALQGLAAGGGSTPP